MISTIYAYEAQDHGENGICHLIMRVETGSMGVVHFEKTCVDYADSADEAIEMVNYMNACLQAN